jgi:YfiH family protein
MEKNIGSDFTLTNAPLPPIKCSALEYTHGFSTRLGGVSTEEGKQSLDLGAGTGSDVSENRKRFASSLFCDLENMFSAKQVHSGIVETVGRENRGQQYECDGFVTAEKGLLLTVKIADCVPVLLEDAKNGVIGAVHAGWRGTVKGIVKNAVEKMILLGAKPENIKAVIGPSIHPCCYEVDDPFVCAVKESECSEVALKFISSQGNGRYRADLQGMNRALLAESGVKSICVSPLCTCCNKELLFSHRGSNGKRGLMMAGIVIDR